MTETLVEFEALTVRYGSRIALNAATGRFTRGATGLLRLPISELPEHLAIVRDAMARAAEEAAASDDGVDIGLGVDVRRRSLRRVRPRRPRWAGAAQRSYRYVVQVLGAAGCVLLSATLPLVAVLQPGSVRGGTGLPRGAVGSSAKGTPVN